MTGMFSSMNIVTMRCPTVSKTQILPLISDSDREQQALFVAFIAQ
jgi:hypothetical protein